MNQHICSLHFLRQVTEGLVDLKCEACCKARVHCVSVPHLPKDFRFYLILSVEPQILPLWVMPAVERPRFSFRGFLSDCSLYLFKAQQLTEQSKQEHPSQATQQRGTKEMLVEQGEPFIVGCRLLASLFGSFALLTHTGFEVLSRNASVNLLKVQRAKQI